MPNSEQSLKTIADLNKNVKNLIRASVVLYIVNVLLGLGFVGTLYYQQQQRDANIRDRIEAGRLYRLEACRGTEDLKTVVRDTVKESIVSQHEYLKDNPQGAPGISRKLIEEGIEKNERLVIKLHPVDCQKVANQ